MKLEECIEDSSQAGKRIYREEFISLYTNSSEVTPFTLMFHEMKNSLYNTRDASYPPGPPTINEVNIEGIWKKTLNGEQFLLPNSEHPIFRMLKSLKHLSKSDNDYLFFDETIKSCSHPFLPIIFHSFC